MCFNKREEFSKETENTFLDIFLPKTKPILIGILYGPPVQSGFLQKLTTAISDTNNFDNQEVFILGDVNINLLYKGRNVPNVIKTFVHYKVALK